MHKLAGIIGCLLMFFAGFAATVRAEEPEKYTKLDSQGQELSFDAGSWVMVRDNKTGLIWEVKTSDGSIHDKEAGYNWEGAHTLFIAELNRMQFGGFTDWRIPTTDELYTIRVKGTEPSIDQHYFPNTIPTNYLSWRKCGSGEIFDEKVTFGKIKNKRASRQVRAVRGGVIQKVVQEE